MLLFSIISLILGIAMSFFTMHIEDKSEKANKAISTAYSIFMGGYCTFAMFMIFKLLKS